jgi:hypothetical protein
MPECLHVTTESGTEYVFTPGWAYVKRTGGDPMRRDGEWIEVVSAHIMLGEPMVMTLRGVAAKGDTRRATTPVVTIERSWIDGYGCPED